MKEFNLSEKIRNYEGKFEKGKEFIIFREDIKEFIRLLKEELSEHALSLENTRTFKKGVVLGVHNIIDKLAGQNLTQEETK